MWIARDKDGELWGFDSKPIRYDSVWTYEDRNSGNSKRLPNKWYPLITWENEPIEVLEDEKMNKRDVMLNAIASHFQNLSDDRLEEEYQTYLEKWGDVDEKQPMSLYECILFVNDYAHQLKETGEATCDYDRLVEALIAVCDYADGCYVNEAEEIGKEAILDITEIEKSWFTRAHTWIESTFSSVSQKGNYELAGGEKIDMVSNTYFNIPQLISNFDKNLKNE